MRGVGAGRLHQGQHGGEGRRAQPEPAGVRGHRRDQGSGGAGVLRRRLLRRHPRLRRQGQRRTDRRERVPGAGGEEGRERVAGGGHRRQPAAPDAQREPAHQDLRLQGAQPEGPGDAVRGAHHRRLALQLLQQPPAGGVPGGAGPDHGPRLRGAAGAAVRRVVPAGAARAHGRRHPQLLRRRVLQGHHVQPGPARLRPGAAQRRQHRRAGGLLRQRPGHLPERLRRRHGQDGLRRRAHRQQRQDQGQLQIRMIDRALHQGSPFSLVEWSGY